MTDKTEHTPLRISGEDETDGYPFLELSIGDIAVADVRPDFNMDTDEFEITGETRDRAEFFVKACNAYYQNQDTIAELVEASEVLLKGAMKNQADGSEWRDLAEAVSRAKGQS